MKRFKIVLFRVVFILSGILFSSFLGCNTDSILEDSDLMLELQSNAWSGGFDEYNEFNSGNVEYREERYVLYFYDNWGFCTWVTRTQDLYEKDRWEEAFMFTYTISGNTVSISTKESPGWGSFTYTNGLLINNKNSNLGNLTATSTTEAIKNAQLERFYPSSGSCGEKTTWKYDRSTKTMTISGNGGVQSYDNGNRPWEGYEIEKLIYKEGVTTTGAYAFSKMRIPNITLASTITQISKFSFYSNSVLESIDIPASCYAIYEEAFHMCHKLKKMTFNGKPSMKDSKLKYLAYRSLFDIAVEFETLELPESMRIIEDGVFFSSGIKHLTLNEGLESLGGYAFSNNAIENDIIIPESMKNISGGFEGSFNKVIIKGNYSDISPFTFQTSAKTGDFYICKNHIGDNLLPSLVLTDCDLEDIAQNWTLHVPVGSKKYYESSWYFSKFGKIVEENY